MREVLYAAFNPLRLEIIDESSKHASHRSRSGISGEETHYNIYLVSDIFVGRSRLARHRAVHEALGPEFRSGLHAVSLTLRTVSEEVSSEEVSTVG